MKLPFRVGLGYDIHRTQVGRRLVLGGVEIAYEYGLDGHSDADCLSHAIADAILGAMALPDIGHFFPDIEPSCKDMDSQNIIRRAVKEAEKRGYNVGNVDAVIVAEAPKIAPYLNQMKTVLSHSLKVDVDCIGLKATTNEKIDGIGQKLAIAAHATCLLYRRA